MEKGIVGSRLWSQVTKLPQGLQQKKQDQSAAAIIIIITSISLFCHLTKSASPEWKTHLLELASWTLERYCPGL